MKWKTLDGRVLDINDMSTEHIKNAAAMLRRKNYVTPDEYWNSVGAACSMQGEMASYYAGQAVSDMTLSPTLEAMEAEIERRTTIGRAA